jgi:predicted house-cleaning noncanonical NTP pyrophosphatase (MazG superfamily)
MKIYNKLVRDKIPEIIWQNGNDCITRTLNDPEFMTELNRKLQEELNEYYESGEVEEIADIMELLYEISEQKGFSKEQMEKIMLEKRAKRGGFKKKLYLVQVFEGDEASNIDEASYLNPDSAWLEILSIADMNRTIYTLKRNRPNEITGVSHEGIKVMVKGRSDLVKKEWIMSAWIYLINNGRLTLHDLPTVEGHKMSFIMALLSKLEYVGYTTDPLTLYIEKCR